MNDKREAAIPDDGKINLKFTTDEVDLLRECMKRTEDYYRGITSTKARLERRE